MRSGISYRFAKSPRSTATKECHGSSCPNVQHFCLTLSQIGSKNSRTQPSRTCCNLFVQKDVWKVSFDMEDKLQPTHSGCLCKVNHVNAPWPTAHKIKETSNSTWLLIPPRIFTTFQLRQIPQIWLTWWPTLLTRFFAQICTLPVTYRSICRWLNL